MSNGHTWELSSLSHKTCYWISTSSVLISISEFRWLRVVTKALNSYLKQSTKQTAQSFFSCKALSPFLSMQAVCVPCAMNKKTRLSRSRYCRQCHWNKYIYGNRMSFSSLADWSFLWFCISVRYIPMANRFLFYFVFNRFFLQKNIARSS